MSQALYRKYRSRSLKEILGQESVTNILNKALEKGDISHAYLLTGPHGVGKTSVARILAHEINNLPYEEDANHLDIIEIDAASNNGVEDIRDLREKVHLAPAIAKYKVYIIDEVHMLSKPAFNALLKTLEEPPRHIVFILATTDADKLPATIISRVQRFNFRSISKNHIKEHLKYIAKNEKIEIDDSALALIAEHANGSFRDSISLLDQLQGGEVKAADVELALGSPPKETIKKILKASQDKDLSLLKKELASLEQSGMPASGVARQLINQIYSDIESNQQHLDVLDELVDVDGSSYPYLRLFIALSKLPSLAAPQPTEKPPQNLEKPKVVAESIKTEPSTELSVVLPTTPNVEKPVAKESTVLKPSKLASNISLPPTIDWQSVVSSVRSINVALYSLLVKSDATYQDGRLIVYVGSSFNQKQVSEPSKQAKLAEALALNQLDGVELEIRAGAKPLEDSSMAAIVDIMGGGEEVKIDD